MPVSSTNAETPPAEASVQALDILVVDDEPRIRKMLHRCLEKDNHAVTTASTAQEALQAVRRNHFDMAFLDLRLGTASGLDLIPDLLEQNPRLKIIIVTAYASIESTVEAMQRGAVDYLPKPFSPEQVRLAVRKVRERITLEAQVTTLQSSLSQARPEAQLESQSPVMQRMLATARQVAESDATILLRGESGTGKGVLARAIHAWSAREKQSFVVVHSPSLPGELFESELFGHAKGAFTGATETNPGRIMQAEGGTLFLDEVGDLPPALQPKLLRFIQDHEFERVGDPTTRHADVRILAATNQDLEAAVAEGRFREDLFYRLNVIELEIPPLRKRPEDIVPLARQFLAFFAGKYNRTIEGFTTEAEEALRRQSWPGNVRELQNAIERAVILGRNKRLDVEHLPLDNSRLEAPAPPQVGEMVTLEALEEAHIRRVIAATETLDEAAETLGIDPATLWRRRKKYDI